MSSAASDTADPPEATRSQHHPRWMISPSIEPGGSAVASNTAVAGPARDREEEMRTSSRWSGWIGFAGWLMVLVGSLDFFEGLIAVIRGKYYVLTAKQIIVFDLRTWGWITLIWGIVVVFAGVALMSRAGWARWFTIVVGSLNVLAQLGFVGGAQYPLWALTIIALSVVVIYALIARWDEVEAAV